MAAAEPAGLPLSSAQNGVWVAQQLDPTGVAYDLGEYLDIRGDVDLELFETALRHVVAHTESLHVRFDAGGEDVRQVVADPPVWEPATADFRSHPDAPVVAEEWMRAQMARPMDLRTGPLFRHALLRVGDQRYFWMHRYHHLVMDGVGMALSARRVAETYTALAEGAPLWPGGDTPLSRMRAEEAAYRASEEFAQDRAFWLARMADRPEPTGFAPLRHPRSGDVVRCHRSVSARGTEGLRAAAQRAGTTWKTAALAATVAYLHRVSGAQDVVVGLAVTGRQRTPEAHNVPGMFANVVPLRVSVREGMCVDELIRTTSRVLREALPHQRYRIEDLQRDLGMSAVDGKLFGVAVNIMAFDYDVTFAGCRTFAHNLSTGPIDDLAVNVYDRGEDGAVAFGFEIDAARCGSDELSAQQRHFVRLVEDLATAHPDTPIGELALLSPEDVSGLLESGAGAVLPPVDRCLHELVEEQARRTPEAVAVRCGGDEISYRELDTWADELARRLRAVTTREQRVGICLRRSVALVSATLAVLKAGCVYVPMDPGLPGRRLEFIARDAGVGLVVSGPESEGRLSSLAVSQVPVGRVPDGRGGAAPAPVPTVVPGQGAYLLYTSGSTGRPKGVLVEHRAAVDFVTQNVRAYRIAATDRFLGFAALTFDVSVLEMFGALASGATLVLATDEERVDAERLQSLLVAQNVTVADLPPALMPLLTPRELPALRLVSVGGEAPSGELVDRWAVEGREFWNSYGPTETTVSVTMKQCPAPSGGQKPSIGRPMANHRVYVVDPQLRLLPPGRPGELCVAGAGLARGYLGRGGLTADRFVPDPWGRPGERMYRTGDLVRWTPEGELEFLGRVDHQVKINGHRIEPGEIETELLRHPDVAQATVVARQTPGTGRSLVAYVVARHGHGVHDDALRAHLGEALPGYMVPHAYVALDRLPLTAGGKVDRAVLPQPERPEAVGRDPRTAREAALCRLFAEVLGLPAVGADDAFFTLGGDSITAIALVSRVRETGLEIALRDVFAHKTPAALAAALRESEEGDRPTGEEHGAANGEFPPTPIMHWLRETGGPVNRFSQSVLLRTPAEADQERLTAAVRTLLDHHDALRMRMTFEDDPATPWSGTVQPPASVDAARLFSRIDISRADEATAHAMIAEARDTALGRLDPAAGVMLQAVWCDAGSERPGRLLLAVHHLAVDGVSWRILLPDLATAWEAVTAGRRPELPAVGTSFRTWAHDLARLAQSPDITGQLPWWRGVLDACEPVLGERLLDPVRDTAGTARHLTLSMPSELVRPLLSTVPAAFGTGVNEILLTALALAADHWRARRGLTGSTPLLLDLEGHGRDAGTGRLDVSRTVGWFTSQFPVRLDLGGIDAARAWEDEAVLARAVEQVAATFGELPRGGWGYGLLRYANPRTQAELTGRARPQILFNYLGRFTAHHDGDWAIAPDAEQLRADTDPGMSLEHCLEVNALVRDHADHAELTATWSWPDAVLSEAEVGELATTWTRALELMVTAAARRDAVRNTSEDFPLARVSRAELDHLVGSVPGIEDILPLSPLQEGIFFHSSYDERDVDAYTGQLILTLDGPLDTVALRRACHRLLQRHSGLRAGFTDHGVSEPVQVVLGACEIPMDELDFHALGEEQRRTALEELLAADRARRFDLARPPLLRFTLVRMGARRHHLVMTNHHILSDGWSTAVLLEELCTAYRDHGAEGGGTPTAHAEVPYRAYLAWLARQDRTAALDAWRRALAGLDEPTILAAVDRNRLQAVPERVTAELTEELTARLVARARSAGVTLNSVVQGVWAVLLARLTGHDDVVFGGTVSGRTPDIPGVETMVGLLINTLPVRFAVRPHEPLIEAVARLQDEQALLLDHQHLGMADIQRESGLGTLFDTTVVFENYPLDRAKLADLTGGLRLTDIKATDATHYTVNLIAVPGRRLRLHVDHRADAIAPEAAAAIARSLERLLSVVVDAPTTAVGRIELLSDQERDRVLGEWNATDHPVPDATLPELLAAQARRTPDRTATVFEGDELSYEELHARANRLAHLLIARGAGPEKTVALALRRSTQMVVAILAVLKSGAAYLPVDPDLPAGRIAYLTEDAAPHLLLTSTDTDPSMPQRAATPRLVLDEPALLGELDRLSPRDPAEADRTVPLLPQHPAYVIYTSGSTGRPKGVVVTHGAIVNRLAWMQESYQLNGTDRVLQKTPFGFDVSVWEFLWPLLYGATLVVARPQGHQDPAYLARVIRHEAVTTVHFVPSMLRAFVDEPSAADCRSLRRVVCSGEALPVRLQEDFWRVLDVPLHNLYGPTEAAVDVTSWTCRPGSATVPIGRPIWNTRLYILDPQLSPLPVGATGELYLAGAGLARGYADRGGLTADRFLPDPFGPPGTRMYRTGDLARWRTDGAVEYLGRTDDQVKIRGLRIELGEIEAVLVRCPEVSQAVVVVHEDGDGDRRLVAYVVGVVGAAVDPDVVRGGLAVALPDYMVPGALVVLDVLPLTPNGKLDRRALPAPPVGVSTVVHQPPVTATEELVAEIWSAVLGTDRIGRLDNFFTLGGHSLKATRAISRLNTRLDAALPLHILFDHPTVADLAAAVETLLLDDILASGDEHEAASVESDGSRSFESQGETA
ncbi:amino acid adenylation domain-containing protein [Streptomyces noursei]|uniref:amino acid adenylation domain-containing protein n=1 Tax=Streptomyces noursei TaxID=1971 RepID=UPI0033D90D5F